MVGDPQARILDAFGVRWPVLGLARRATFVLDAEGIVRARIVSEVLIRRHIEQALEAVRSLAAKAT
jgi:peroxiredoxin 2/4